MWTNCRKVRPIWTGDQWWPEEGPEFVNPDHVKPVILVNVSDSGLVMHGGNPKYNFVLAVTNCIHCSLHRIYKQPHVNIPHQKEAML